MSIGVLRYNPAALLTYTSRYWDVSQNIDRVTDTSPPGLVGCITPHCIPFFSSRGRPLIGWETLALQGLPADKLLLGRLNESQTRDLVGNAMSTTVVASAIFSVLLACSKFLVADLQPRINPPQSALALEAEATMDESHLTDHQVLDLTSFVEHSVQFLLDIANSSKQMCFCETNNTIASAEMFRCVDCGHTSCGRCKSDWVHNYAKLQSLHRTSPDEVAALIKEALPMRMCLQGQAVFDLLRCQWSTKAKTEDLEIIIEPLEGALNEEFRFSNIKRSNCWTVNFAGPSLSLGLQLHDKHVVWHLYAKADKLLPGNARERQLFRHPIARMVLNADAHHLLDGNWEMCIPVEHLFHVEIDAGQYNQVDSWPATLGLVAHAGSKVSEFLDISTTVREDNDAEVPNLAGKYQLLPNCDAASASLHQKTTPEADGSQLYFFLDPDRNSHPSYDRYVFAKTKHRTAFGEVRQVSARLRNEWKPTEPNGTSECEAYGKWISSNWRLKPFENAQPVTVAMAPSETMFDLLPDSIQEEDPQSNLVGKCNSQHVALTSVTIPLDTCHDRISSLGAVRQAKQEALFRGYSWILERLPNEQLYSDKWTTIDVSSDLPICQNCSPSMPSIKWKRVLSKKNNKQQIIRIIPYEDEKQAASYERGLKLAVHQCSSLSTSIRRALRHRASSRLE